MTSRIPAAFALAALFASAGAAQQPPAPQAGAAQPRTARSVAPIDLTGYWVAVVTEDWRWRMLTPAKGDYASIPMTDEGRKVADSWDLAKDEAAGNACKPFGVGNIMRMPGRLHITWQDDSTLKLEFDAGTQTRLLHFDGRPPAGGERTWQGYSAAAWEIAGQALNLDRNNIPQGPSPTGVGGAPPGGGGGGGGRGRGAGRGAPPRGGSLRVATTNFRDGYLRKNGYPYSANATVSEYFDRLGPEPNGDVLLLVRTVIEDSKYLNGPFITSTHFKQEKDGAKWSPTPCKIDPPVVPGR